MVQNLENEIWMPVINYDGLYEISNMGRLKSLPKEIKGVATYNQPEKIKKSFPKESGYLKSCLRKNGVVKSYSVHRLVILSFTGEHPELKEVNHKNGIKSDNRLENLEWSNRSKNIKHSYELLGRKNNNTPFKTGKDHVFYTKGYNVHNKTKVKCDTLDMEFDSQSEAEKALGLWKGSVCDMLKGRITNIQGLVFRYL